MISRRLAHSKLQITATSTGCIQNTLRAARLTTSARRHSRPLTLGIRREDPGRLWERRSPLTPSAVATLIKDQGVDVVVQGCERRVFSNAEYEAVSDDLLYHHGRNERLTDY